MKNCVIYKITNPNGHLYIGKTKNWNKRYNVYKSLNCKDQPALYNSFLKYGFENHTFEILMQDISEEILSNVERLFIFLEDAFKNSEHLNCTEGGDGVSGFKHSELAKLKASKANKGKVAWNKGVPCDEETKEKIRKSNTGYIHSEISKQKMSISRTGPLNHIYGIGHTEDTKKKMRKPKSVQGKNNIALAIITKRGMKILCIETGTKYPSQRLAGRDLNINQREISKMLKGKLKHVKGFTFIKC